MTRQRHPDDDAAVISDPLLAWGINRTGTSVHLFRMAGGDYLLQRDPRTVDRSMTYRVIPRHLAIRLYDELANKALGRASAFPDEPML
jgi:hypothetical protein